MSFSEANVPVDARSIDVCLDFLLKLKQQSGAYDRDELWTSDILPRLNNLRHWSNDIALLSSAQETLRALEGTKHALAYLLDSLQGTMTAVKTALLPFQRGKGLDSLPDDILSTIFVYVGSRPSLVSVCRRFRQVASEIPQLWSSISGDMSLQRVHASLTESKAVGLDIAMDLEPTDLRFDFNQNLLQILEASLAHIDRWENLRFSFERAYRLYEIKHHLAGLEKLLKDIQMPRLHTFSLDYPDMFMDGIDDNSDGDVHFYRSWSLPHLRNLSVSNIVPVAFSAPALTSVTIELGARDDARYGPNHLIAFLSSIPQLEHLRLTIEALLDEADPPSLVLHHLKSLRMHVIHLTEPQIPALRKALITPSILSMHFTVEQHEVEEFRPDLTNWLDIFLCHEEYPTLNEFIFEFFDQTIHSEYKIPFHKLPNLRALTLDTHHWHAVDDSYHRSSVNIPPLRSLHLKDSNDSQWMSWLVGIHRKMRDQGKLSDFRDLTIDLVETFDKGCISQMFENKSIEWRGTTYNVIQQILSERRIR